MFILYMTLNTKQKSAIEILNKPLIVIAGPGTGKTTLITEKIKYLLNKDISEDKILALTFTNKAAEEMGERVQRTFIGENNKSSKVSTLKNSTNQKFTAKTFHSFALDLIEEYKKNIPLISKEYTLIEENNQTLFFLENLDKFNLKSIEIKNNHTSIAYELQSAISKLKDFGITLKELDKENFTDIQTKLDIFSAYLAYEKYKQKHHLIDFGDIINYIYELLKTNKKIRDEVTNKYKYILVDEFQDTNKIQLEIIKLISKNNITIVGDQKQSIYSFRGANYKNLDLFKSHFKNYEEIYLTQNYRSSKNVLENINTLTKSIASDKEILDLTLKEKGKVNLIETINENSQVSYIINKINEIKEKDKTATIGILTRRKVELITISNQLKNLEIDHQLNEANYLFQNEYVKELVNLLKIINNSKEANSQLFQLLKNINIRDETKRKISRASSLKEKSIYNVLKSQKTYSEYDDENNLLKEFQLKLEKLINFRYSKSTLFEILKLTLEEFNIYKKAIINNDSNSIFAINSFLDFTRNYLQIYNNNDFDNFLKVCDLSNKLNINYNNETTTNNIQLMTIHQSKGREFDYVILPYLNWGKFPSSYKKSHFELPINITREQFELEEERLFFVAISRAKKDLNLTYVKKYSQNKLDSKPSKFLNKLNLEKQIYSNTLSFLTQNSIDTIESELIQKVMTHLLHKNYDTATDEISLLKSLFSKKKDLMTFTNQHPDLNYYKEKLKGNIGPNIKLDTSKLIYSVSQLKTYESCPQKYLYTYIYKIPSTPKHYFDFGTSMHEVLEHISDEITIDIDETMIFAKAMKLLNKFWISKGYINATQEKEYFEKAVIGIKKFITKQKRLSAENRKTIGKEQEFLINLNGKRIYGIIDRIDRVDDNYEILDYKTSNSMVYESKLKDDIQLIVYALALKTDPKLYHTYPKKMGLWYLIHDKITLIDFDEKNIEKVTTQILKLIDGIENKIFDANASHFNCTYCDYSNICPHSFK